MADPIPYMFDAFTKVYLVPTIADIAAPTVAELAAGTDISCWLTPDGLDTGVSESAIDVATLCSTVDGETPGTSKYAPSLKLFRGTTDTAWIAVVHNTAVHLVVRRGVATDTAWAAAQKVEVYKGKYGNPQPASSARNTPQTFMAKIYVSAVNLKAVVAA